MAKKTDKVDKRGKRRNTNFSKVMRWLKSHGRKKK